MQQNNKCEEFVHRFCNNLKIGALRLGKTIFFINTTETKRRVFLMSVDSKMSPHYEDTYVYFSYIEDLTNGSIDTIEGLHHKNIIISYLKSHV
jgi:hypothetical protein